MSKVDGCIPAGLRVKAFGIAGVVVITLLLAGCDQCGDFRFAVPGDGQVCRNEAPRPQ